MSHPINYQQIPELHAAFVRLTGSDLALNFQREDDWRCWLLQRPDRPFSAADLVAVVSYLKGEIRAERRPQACLKFHNLVGRPDIFEQDLCDATARLRRPPPAVQTVQTRGPEGQVTERRVTGDGSAAATRTLGDVVASDAFKRFVELKEKLTP